ncbi:MAG: BamA/TamA family outer membrane protein [Gemmatimonadota bacterium]
MPTRRIATLTLAVVLGTAVTTSSVQAQYFGQNKVQYDDFEWRVIPTDHLDVHFYEATRGPSLEMARAAERWHWRLARVFGHELSERKPVVMYANHPDFQQTNIIQGEIGLGTGGLTDPTRNRATQPYTGDFHGSAHVVGHELVHVFQFDIAETAGGTRAMAALPLWLIEGMAEYLSVGRVDPHTAMWMRDAVLRGDIPTIEDLSTGRYFPYRYGQSLMAYVGGRWGDRAVTALYTRALEVGLGSAIEEVTGLTPAALSQAWAQELRRTYLPLVQDREAPADVGREILPREVERGNMNLAPVLSPDGRWVALISERDLFSINVFVADVETGEIVRRLTSTDREPHFDALNFLETAGAWSPDGRYFVYVVVDDGDNELRIADVRRGRSVQSIELGVSALNDPAWSPDGRYLAFSGGSDGLSNLYLYDRETERLTQLTDGMYSELQPTWSPDGGSLVFVTDRGPQTNLELLEFGPLRLARMDLDTREIELLPGFEGAKHIDPQFSPDGTSLYFISDRGGVSDIFRLDLRTDRFYRVTRTATGISGITAHSPALSVASETGRLAFSIFSDNQYTLHTLEASESVGEPVTEAADVAPAGVLPPVTEPGVVGGYLAASEMGLPRAVGEVQDYDASLGLDYVGPPMVGASVDQFGTNIGGSVSFAFRDLLGNRTLGVHAMAQGELQDLGGQVFYENREDRLNWGVVAGRVPYRSGRRQVEPVEGQRNVLVTDQIFRTYLNQAGAQIAYPFSRARRAEASASYTLYTYDAEAQQFLCTPTGAECDQVDEFPLEELEPEAVSLFQATAAYVGDWANFAFTGPVVGGRYRFELEPTFGDIQFTTALADYRRYFFWRPVTLAVRGLHYGRYGEDADNRRFLSPLFLGAAGLVRGYTTSSFRSDECSGLNGGNGCPEFDRLIGSRIGVASAELRIPLLGVPEFGLFTFPLLPTTVGAFFDAGVAWTGDESPELEFATESTGRIPVTSAGVFARANVLGFVVVGLSVAHPFQRPHQDWVFGFELQPGW